MPLAGLTTQLTGVLTGVAGGLAESAVLGVPCNPQKPDTMLLVLALLIKNLGLHKYC